MPCDRLKNGRKADSHVWNSRIDRPVRTSSGPASRPRHDRLSGLARTDAEGFACWPGAILGHRRLSIFDLSELGNQPMLSADRQVGVVFNGAIYNFLELRRELEQEGCEFRSRSDTEVLVHGYRRWGIETMLPKLRGMFAIGIWDAAKRKLYVVATGWA